MKLIHGRAGVRNSEVAPVTLTIAGLPIPKARPRFSRLGTYAPKATRAYEVQIAWTARLAMRGRQPISGPVKVVALVELPIPGSWSIRKRAAAIAGMVAPASKPDLDNFAKSLLDGINKIVFKDDSQVVDLHARKKYGVDPKIVATVSPLSGGAL